MRYGGYYLTAYGIAKKHGFTGTEEEWLTSLHGRDLETLRILDDGTLQAVYSNGTKEAIAQFDERAQWEYTDLINVYDEVMHLKSLVGSPLTASTAGEMTDRDKVYVYTGSEDGMTAGSWYYHDGAAWRSGGVYNAAAVQTDRTLQMEGQAADAKKTGDVLRKIMELVGIDGADWEPGSINASTGADVQNSPKRIRISGRLVINPWMTVRIAEGAKVGIRLYKEDGTFQLFGESMTETSFNLADKIKDFSGVAESYYVRFTAGYVSEDDVEDVDDLASRILIEAAYIPEHTDEAEIRRWIFRNKDETANNPAALTFWRPAQAGHSAEDPFSPGDMPANSYAYALGSYFTNAFLPSGVVKADGRGYWIWKFVSFANTNIRLYAVYSNTGELYIGHTASGGAPNMHHLSPPTASIMFFGDSIARGINSDSGAGVYSDVNLPVLLTRELGCTVDNYGIGSIGWLHNGNTTTNPDANKGRAIDYLERVGLANWYWDGTGEYVNNKFIGSVKTWADYNTVVLAYGANDRAVGGSTTELGSLEDIDDTMSYEDVIDMTPTTIVQAIYQCYRYIREQAPTINIILSDPLLQVGGTAPEWSYPTRRAEGSWTWYELNDLYAAFARKYGCGHISNYEAPINRVDPTISLKDNVHPTTDCYRQLARHFAGKISALVR